MEAARGSSGRLRGARPKPMGGSAAAGVETLAGGAPPSAVAAAPSRTAAALDSDADWLRRSETTLVGLRAQGGAVEMGVIKSGGGLEACRQDAA